MRDKTWEIISVGAERYLEAFKKMDPLRKDKRAYSRFTDIRSFLEHRIELEEAAVEINAAVSQIERDIEDMIGPVNLQCLRVSTDTF